MIAITAWKPSSTFLIRTWREPPSPSLTSRTTACWQQIEWCAGNPLPPPMYSSCCGLLYDSNANATAVTGYHCHCHHHHHCCRLIVASFLSNFLVCLLLALLPWPMLPLQLLLLPSPFCCLLHCSAAPMPLLLLLAVVIVIGIVTAYLLLLFNFADTVFYYF